jgi:intracellular multiplication protein IcmQ
LIPESADKILKILDKAIDSEVWEGSMILRVVHKRLMALRGRFSNEQGRKSISKNLDKRVSELFQDQVVIYITLYSSSGRSLDTWGKLLRLIESGVQGRPAYRDEMCAKNYVNSKRSAECNGYVAIRVYNKYLLNIPEDKVAKDALGQPIVSFLPRALDDRNIVEFVHNNSIRYTYKDGQLFPS